MAERIVIIGGGMVGLAFAITCQYALPHADILVLEARPLPTGTPDPLDTRASALNLASQSILSALGVWRNLEVSAGVISQIHVSHQAHFGSAMIEGSDLGVPDLGYVVENHIIGRGLKERADAVGVTVKTPCEVECLSTSDAQPAIYLATGEVLHADLVIVADGSQSSLRHQLGIDVEWRRTGQHAVVANVSFAGSQQGIAFERFTPSGPMALLPLASSAPSEQRFNVVWSLTEGRARDLMALDDEAFLGDLQRHFGWRLGRALRVGRRNTWSLDRVRVREQSRSGFLVAGNAAHGIHPVAGQGLNLSLRDAASLGATLKVASAAGRKLGDLATARDYEHKVLPDQERIVDATDLLSTLFEPRGMALDLPRDVALTSLDLIRPLRRHIAERGTGLDTLTNPAWKALFAAPAFAAV